MAEKEKEEEKGAAGTVAPEAKAEKTEKTEAPKAEAKPEPAPEPQKTMEEIADTVAPEAKETVGLDKFLELKKENREYRKSIKDLEAKIQSGATQKEVSADIKALSDEYPDVNPDFLGKLAATIRAQVEKDADDRIESRLKPLEQKEKAAKIDEAFNTHFNLAMEKMPEFKAIVNPDVIKTLSLNPANSNKTFSQIIEETYGGALSGKRTIDSQTPGGGKEPAPLEFDRARSDKDYFMEIMKNPKLKAEYNQEMLSRGF